MSKSLYITGIEPKTGKSAIVLGVMQILLRNLENVAFFRPIINTPSQEGVRDHDINLILKHFDINIPYEDTYAFTLSDARHLINKGQNEHLLDQILAKYKKLESEHDFVLCEGTDFMGKDVPFEFQLNVDIADTLGCPVLATVTGLDRNATEIIELTQPTFDIMANRTIEVAACIVNRAQLSRQDTDVVEKGLFKSTGSDQEIPTYVIPEEPTLGKPTMADVQKWLNADVLFGRDRMDTMVDDFIIGAMNPSHFLEYLNSHHVVITPGDRDGIILASLAARASSAYTDPAGLVLTGGFDMSDTMKRLISGWEGVALPILSVEHNTIECAEILSQLYGRIDPKDLRKISTALGHFEANVNAGDLSKRIVQTISKKISPKMFEYNLIERAARHKMRIVLPEGEDERILKATEVLLRRNVAEITILGDATAIGNKISALGLDIDPIIIQPEDHPKFAEYAQELYELRKSRGLTEAQAKDTMRDATYFGTMMVHKDDADGMVSGAVNTTAHTIRPAFQIIKTKPGTAIVSSVFLMCMKDRVLVFGDCAVNPNPSSEQLASIAISSAQTAKTFGIDPLVAMLSYSTGASGAGEDVQSVVEATKLAKEMAPELMLEGPLQYDAAIDAGVAKTKLPDSEVAGKATVFIFPDLNTGNNTYKAVQRAADAVAIGPVLQGLNKPVNDLSRGCTVADIVNTVAITAIQAQSNKGLE